MDLKDELDRQFSIKNKYLLKIGYPSFDWLRFAYLQYSCLSEEIRGKNNSPFLNFIQDE